MAAPRVIPAFHSTGSCITQFAIDLAKALRYTGTLAPMVLHEQSCYVDSARNRLVRNFLQTEGTHLLMMDVDLSFEPDAIVKTLTIMTQYGADVLYGNYSLGNHANSIFGPPENITHEAAVLVKLEPNKVYDQVVTGGTGWVMVKRELLQRMEKECPGPWHWFARDPTSDGTDLRGEDISFGLRVYNMEPRPRVLGTTAILLRHFKLQPFIPELMSSVSASEKIPALAFPNPYEHQPEKYIVNGHLVVDRAAITSEQADELLAQIRAREVAAGKVPPDVQPAALNVPPPIPFIEELEDAEGLRSNEGQVREGGGSGLASLQRGAVESSSDLQLEAPRRTRDGRRKAKAS